MSTHVEACWQCQLCIDAPDHLSCCESVWTALAKISPLPLVNQWPLQLILTLMHPLWIAHTHSPTPTAHNPSQEALTHQIAESLLKKQTSASPLVSELSEVVLVSRL